jgi:hypothetical protein
MAGEFGLLHCLLDADSAAAKRSFQVVTVHGR